MSRRPVRRALISVSDKTGLAGFARRLAAAGVELVSSGGTAAALRRDGIEVTDVSDVTGAPEILGGRVKTLHPKIHGGVLAVPEDAAHAADLEANGIAPFELVVVNLYPFEAAVAAGAAEADAIEQIDIGGPALVRAAAKNHAYVGVVTSPRQYDEVAAAVEGGGLDDDLRRSLAQGAFALTAAYDAAIVGWLHRDELLPPHLILPLVRQMPLRYGENPAQQAAAYRVAGAEPWWAGARQLQGKELSFNNLIDAEAAWRLASDIGEDAAVVVKHTNPCGAAVGDTLAEAMEAAWECDPLSAFGGIVALNRVLDPATAAFVADRFVEVVIAPDVAEGAVEILAGRPNMRVLVARPPAKGGVEERNVEGGFLVQARDEISADPATWRIATERSPTADELASMGFAWLVAAHTKSNAVVIAAGGAAVGVGAGDQSRVGAAERAVAKAGKRAEGAVAASDAFLPFRDALDVLADAGVTALVQPGGSKRDGEVVDAANERGIAMVFTDRRHFRH